MLHRVNLHAVRKQKLGGYSGGMRQRFGIAQAMLGNPKLVIVDEPTAGLDPEERVRFHNLLADIASDVVVILSTHIVSDVADLCGSFAIINGGRVLLTGEPAALVAGLQNRVWRKVVTKAETDALKARVPVVSTRLQAGRTVVRASETSPPRPASSRSRRTWRTSTSAPSPAPCRAGREGRLSMVMLSIAWFDFVRRLRMISTYVYFVLYAAIAGLWMAAAGGALSHASVNFGGDKVLINGSYALAIAIAILGFTGITVIGSVVGRAVQQDYEYGTYHFFFTAPIRKRDYFFGRLFGAYLTLGLVFLGIAVGVLIGTHWPGVDPARVVTVPSWQSFVRPYLFLLLPNVLWLGGCFFVLAALTRQMAPVYVAGVVALIGYLFSVNLLGDMENKTLAALVDPSGATALDVLARYWSVAQKNADPIPLSGTLLWNRALWLAVGIAATLLGFAPFACRR